jgi:hypothetical protein
MGAGIGIEFGTGRARRRAGAWDRAKDTPSILSVVARLMSQLPATIKAITFSKTGGVEVIEKTDQPFPQQRPGDIILKVHAATRRLLHWHKLTYSLP